MNATWKFTLAHLSHLASMSTGVMNVNASMVFMVMGLFV